MPGRQPTLRGRAGRGGRWRGGVSTVEPGGRLLTRQHNTNSGYLGPRRLQQRQGSLGAALPGKCNAGGRQLHFIAPGFIATVVAARPRGGTVRGKQKSEGRGKEDG